MKETRESEDLARLGLFLSTGGILYPPLYRNDRTEVKPLIGLDPGIARYVETLRQAGIETFESCQGGPGHAYPEPTIRFHGPRDEGFRALAVSHQQGLPLSELRRTWPILDGEPTGPHWEIVFRERAC
jgi:hypothetical protein